MAKPTLFFQFIDLMLMPLSFSLSMWVTNFEMFAAQSKDVLKWEFLSLLPILLSLFFFIQVVRRAAILRCVSMLDGDVIEEVIEQSQESTHIATFLREKIIARLKKLGDPENSLKQLFNEIDLDGSNLLSRQEFQLFLGNIKSTILRTPIVKPISKRIP